MAKKIKFPLQMKNDAQVRDLDELREHFDLDKVIGFFLDGKLLSWCEARYYDAEADALRALDKDDAGLHRRLCEIFGVEYHAEEAPKIDVEAVEERNRRLSELKQYTSDPTVLEKIDQVAFNQEELADLIDEGYSAIYLCNNSFVIPLRVRNKKYIGIGKAEAVIRSQERVEFDEFGIAFEDVKFDDAYEKLTPKTPEETYDNDSLYNLAESEEKAKDYETALKYYRELANRNYPKGLYKVGLFYDNGYAVEQNRREAYKFYIKAADLGHGQAMHNIGVLYFNGTGVIQNWAKGQEWYQKAVDCGTAWTMFQIGKNHIYGSVGYSKDVYEALRWFNMAADYGSIDAIMFVAESYANKYTPHWGFDLAMAKQWYERAANAGHTEALLKIALLGYWEGNDWISYLSPDERFRLYKEAAELGNIEGMKSLGTVYLTGTGVEQNLEESLKWLNKVLDNGDTSVMFSIGNVYEEMNELEEALKWYQKCKGAPVDERIAKIRRCMN